MELDRVLALADSYLDKYTPSTSEHVGDATRLTAPKSVTKAYPINAGDDPEGKAFYMRGWVMDHRCMREISAFRMRFSMPKPPPLSARLCRAGFAATRKHTAALK